MGVDPLWLHHYQGKGWEEIYLSSPSVVLERRYEGREEKQKIGEDFLGLAQEFVQRLRYFSEKTSYEPARRFDCHDPWIIRSLYCFFYDVLN